MSLISSWPQRVATLLRESPRLAYLAASRDSGVEYAIRHLETTEMPVVWVWFEHEVDSLGVANELSRALHQALGSPLFGQGFSLSDGLAVMRREISRLAPLQFIVGWLEHCEGLADELYHLATPPNRLLIIGSEEPTSLRSGVVRIDDASLLMSTREALAAADGTVDRQEIIDMMLSTDGKYGAFSGLLRSKLNLPLIRSRPWVAAESASHRPSGDPEPSQVFRILVGRSRWIEALELACDAYPYGAPDVVEQAGHMLANQGAFEYLLVLLGRLPSDVKKDPRIAYWLWTAATATNRFRSMRRFADAELSGAPELRAALAVQRPNGELAAETLAALEAKESPVTLRARAFAMAFEGDRERPIRLFRRAMRQAEDIGADHLVVACAIDIANQETALGRYVTGSEWACWAHSEFHRRGLREELRRQTAITGTVYPRILSGATDEIPDLLEALGPYSGRLGVPVYESVASTLGDWEFVNRRFEQALSHYLKVQELASLDQRASAALDVIRCHIAMDNEQAAIELANSVHALARSSSRQERAFAELGMGIALHRVSPDLAKARLYTAIEALGSSCFVVLQAQAAIWLALVMIEAGDLQSAREALELGRVGLTELGDSGWQLLSAWHGRYRDAQTLWQSDTGLIEILTLGDQRLRGSGGGKMLSLRFCEILVLLAQHPEGLRSQRLQLMLFGDGGTVSNIKATMSKLRRVVPITPSPYRIGCKFRIDCLELLGLLSVGRLQQALSLYRGPLLPESEAPAIRELRAVIDEGLRGAVIESGDPEVLIHFATTLGDDLEVWERAKASLLPDDHRRPLVNARIRRIRASW